MPITNDFTWGTFTDADWQTFTTAQWDNFVTAGAPLPISELIAEDILATVETITTANGHNFTLTAQRHSRAGDQRVHLNAIIVQDDPREVPEKVYFTKEWWLPFNIGVFVIPDEDDATPIDEYCNLIKADVEKALMIDRYRSGYALDTQIRASHTISDEGLEYDIAVINVEINYRTLEIDPYANAV